MQILIQNLISRDIAVTPLTSAPRLANPGDEIASPGRIAPVTSGFGGLGRSVIARLQFDGRRVAATRAAAGKHGQPFSNRRLLRAMVVLTAGVALVVTADPPAPRPPLEWNTGEAAFRANPAAREEAISRALDRQTRGSNHARVFRF